MFLLQLEKQSEEMFVALDKFILKDEKKYIDIKNGEKQNERKNKAKEQIIKRAKRIFNQ